jgi:hypothetical protein
MNKPNIFIITGVSATILAIAFGIFATFSHAFLDSTNRWKRLINVTKNSRAIIEDNTAPSANHSKLERKATAKEMDGLLLVDFNSPLLCGMAGCSLVGYDTSTQEKVLNLYIKRDPERESIVEMVPTEVFEYPCLLVPAGKRLTIEAGAVDLICYDEGEWKVTQP